ncbi:MAG: hypothetical protein HZC11_01275 [Nitrospirae bacterium]|nr:hypothetical protein [Nitrospirota bacterium]
MLKIEGYIVEILKQNGDIDILWKKKNNNEMFIIKSKLDMPWMTPGVKLNRRLRRANIYKYNAEREIQPYWIYIVVFPKNYTFTTYTINLPIPKKNLNSYDTKSFPIHIGPNFQTTALQTDRHLCLYYINPNAAPKHSVKTQMDIIPINNNFIKNWNNIYFLEKKNLIDKIIEEALNDVNDNTIRKQNLDIQNQNKLIYYFSHRVFLRKIRKHPYIKVTTKKGGHQYKAINIKTRHTTDMPYHSKEINPKLVEKITNKLGISI